MTNKRADKKQKPTHSFGEAMNRRDFLKSSAKATIGAACFVVLNPFAAGFPGHRRNGQKAMTDADGVQTFQGVSLDRAIYAMGTIVSITAVGRDKRWVENAIEAAFDEIRQVEQLMSVHDKHSQLSALNRAAGEQLVRVDGRVLEVAEAAMKYGRLTDGMLDVTVLPLMRLWGFYDQRNGLPGSDELRKNLSLVNAEHIKIDRKNQRIGLNKKGVQMDFGGVAKGYAVDRAGQVLRKYGVKSAIINGGGDIYAMGSPPDSDAWLVGITDPLKPEQVFATTTLKDQAMATSGSYERYRIIDGKKYGHIIHPRTGLPVAGTLSTTVVAPSTLEADALSTAAFVFGPKQGTELLQDLTRAEGVLVGEKGLRDISVTVGLRNKITFTE